MSSSESEVEPASPEPPPFDPQNVTEAQLMDIVNDAEHADGDIRKLALTRARYETADLIRVLQTRCENCLITCHKEQRELEAPKGWYLVLP